jgi:hypothetical protein
MIAAFEENLPEGLVLGVESRVINLDRKYNLLLESEYALVRSEVQPLLIQARKHIAEKNSAQQSLFKE